ncbi:MULTISPECIES: DUF4123 domain-containing protein [Pseudomonas]|uniref:DUF4123 domain-containing protein n=3 Tax=Pseudomonas TaxID=286 RepID=A0A0G3GLT4_9PSED|nr:MULTISPECIES: DUF4123 domain-containing protein [Pseudomonas]AKK01535.1 hypothetical protein VM99_27205 [Pseudomonas chlororaphis]KIQ60359.1 hypothetical protein RL74_05930 [Pseudomonas fluorescens]ROM82274.1 hypothetical protein BK652_17445 [Pseudomonas brassicacearum]
MTQTYPHQWLSEHQHLGHSLCVVLDSENEGPARQAFLKNSRPDQYLSVYGQTEASDLNDAGPFVFGFDQPDDPNVSELLRRPESHWGWLASLPKGSLFRLVEHWRERMIVGTRPHQALYRFHDNRVLSRALEHLPLEAYPAYLGPAISVCYWQGTRWKNVDNPAPGKHPVPDSPLWLEVPFPRPQAMEARRLNAHRILLAEHLQAYAELAEQQAADTWLQSVLDLAETWNWQAPGQLEFLLTQRLRTLEPMPPYWHVRPGEDPDEHFDRVRSMADFWQGGAPL